MRRSITFRSLLKCRHLITDVDGNIYHSVILGSQEWLVENLMTTKYRDGTPILNLINATAPNLVTSWTNISWDTFASSGPNLTSAIKATGSYGTAESNIMTLTTLDIISGTINVTLNSGTLGRLVLLKNGATYSWLDLVSGVNVFGWMLPENNNYQLQIMSSNVGTNMSSPVVAHSVNNGAWTTDTTGAYCWYDNDIVNKTIYGALYNWFAVNNTHLLAPTGWRISTKTDWTNLKIFLDTLLAEKIKEVGLTHWNSPNAGTDNYGFKLRGAGRRNAAGLFLNLLDTANIWTSNLYDANNAENNVIYHDSDIINQSYGLKNDGYSVRCVRDVA